MPASRAGRGATDRPSATACSAGNSPAPPSVSAEFSGIFPLPRSGQDGFGCVSRDPGEYTDSSGSPHAPLARNYTACRLVSLIGPRVSGAVLDVDG